MAKLYDQFGREIDLSALRHEHAEGRLASIRTPWHAPQAHVLTPPKLASILRRAAENDATDYLTLAEEIEEREAHYRSVLGTRKLAVAGLQLSVTSASDDAVQVQHADAARALFKEPAADNLRMELLDGLAKGYSVVETIWDTSEKQWHPRAFEWRDPRFFRFDRETGQKLRLLDESNPADGVELAPYKFIVHQPRLKTGLPIRGGLARVAAAPYMCKAWTLTDWMAFADVFGMPLRVGRHGPNATAAEIATLVNAVANIGTDAAAVIPATMNIEFVKGEAGAGGPELFQKLAEWLDKQTSKVVLGQTMTTDDGASLAQAKVHENVRSDLLRADALQLSRTLTRDVVRPFIDLNYGPQKAYPTVELLVEEPEDLVSLSKSLPPFIDRGLKVAASVIRDKFGLPEPEPDEELLQTSSAPAKTPPGSSESVATNRSGAALDEIDTLVDEAMAEWVPMVEPLLSPIRAAVERATSLDDLKLQLAAAGELIDSSVFAHQIAVKMFEARALGLDHD